MSEISGLSAPTTIPDYGSMASMMDKWTAFSSFCGLKGDKTVSETASKLKELNTRIEAQGKALSQMRRLKTELGTDNDKDKTSADFLAKNPSFESDLNLALKNAGWAPFPREGAIVSRLTENQLDRKTIEKVLSDPVMLQNAFAVHGRLGGKIAATTNATNLTPADKQVYIDFLADAEKKKPGSIVGADPNAKIRQQTGLLFKDVPKSKEQVALETAMNLEKKINVEANDKVQPEFYTGGIDGKVTRRQLAEKLEVLENEQKANVQSINEVMTELSQAIQHQGNNWERLADVIKKLGDLIDSILRNTQ